MEIKLEFLTESEAIVGEILVEVNQQVQAGDELLTYEAAKGTMELLAPKSGIIEEIFFFQGDLIKQGDVLLKLFPTTAEQTLIADNTEIIDSFHSKKTATDILIIGAGPGGYEAAIYAAKNGLDVTLVESNSVGGTCLNEGCIPTKAFNKAAGLCQEIDKASKMGIISEVKEVQISRLVDWKDEIKSTLVDGILSLLKTHNIKLIAGTAHFKSKSSVCVTLDSGEIEIQAKHIIIATGSSSTKPNIPGSELPQVIDSRTALSQKALPSTLTIIGGGVIGMEFAFIYHNLGVNVQVLEYQDNLLPMLDKDVSQRIQVIAEKKGICIQSGAKVKRIENTLSKEALVVYEVNGQEKYAVSEKVLTAVGRSPNIKGLNLEAAEIALKTNGQGIDTNEYFQTNQENIYAIGDVNNKNQLAHAASHQGFTAVKDILKQNNINAQSLTPSVIFTVPEIALVGKTENDCHRESISYEVFKFPYSGNGKALILDDIDGFVKLIKSCQNDTIIGGCIIGPDASTLINTITSLIHCKATQKTASQIIFPHPTTGETIMESILGLDAGAIHSTNKKEVHIF